MPVTFSFELEGAVHEAELVGSMFERMGWERLDASTYRYPRLAPQFEESVPDDWLNHIAPSLMLFRSFVLTRALTVRSYSIEAHSSSGYRREAEVGSPPLHAEHMRMYEPSESPHSTEARSLEERPSEEWAALKDWLDSETFPAGL